MSGDAQLLNDFRWTPKAIGVLRIVAALLFLQHGMTKILSYPLSSASGPPEWSLLWVAGLLELVGSLMLLIGLFTRPVALVLAGEMAIAYWMVHAPRGPFPMLNDGESTILFCFIFLLFVATGAAKWSVDEILLRRRSDVEGYAGPGGERQYSEDELGGGSA